MNVYIPTYRREKQTTADALLADGIQVTFVVDEVDEARLRVKYPQGEFLVCPVQGEGIHLVRQWILDYFFPGDIAMFDDDLSFKIAYYDQGKKKFRATVTGELRGACNRAFHMLQREGVHAVGFGLSFMNTADTPVVSENTSVIRAFFIDCLTKARFDHAPVSEDLAFCVDVCSKGKKVLRINDFISCSPSTPAPGGVDATGDRAKMMDRAIDALTSKFPKYAREFVNNNPVHFKQFGTRRAIRFYVHQAYKDAMK